MKAQISSAGILLIERAGTMKEQHCIHRHAHYCCDECPLFGEPTPIRSLEGYMTQDSKMQLCQGSKMQLCQGSVIIGQIEDARPRPAAEPSDADGGL